MDLKKVVNESKQIFGEIDHIGEQLRNSSGDLPPGMYLEWLDKATGCYVYLAPIHRKLKAIKTNKEAKEYMNLKLKASSNNEKFVSAVAERESSLVVSEERLVRDIFEGYVIATEAIINTCKKHIKSFENENDISADL